MVLIVPRGTIIWAENVVALIVQVASAAGLLWGYFVAKKWNFGKRFSELERFPGRCD